MLRHGAHGGELGADLVDFVTLKRMFFTDLLDFLITQHSSCLSDLVLFLFTSLGLILGVFPVILLNLERGSSCPLMSVSF